MKPNVMWLLLSLVLTACGGPDRPRAMAPAVRPPLILVSIDGFRPNYLDRGVTPNLNALAAAGVRARAMRPSFPSTTFPNHYTLVTGLRPDRHGIVSNIMEDAAIPGVRFTMSNRDAVRDRRWWDQGEPIWVTAENAGLRTATAFWPGSEAAIHGVRPTQWQAFDGTMPGAERVDRLLESVDGPDRPAFLTLYFDTVDHEGHDFGPDSARVTAAVAAVDAQIGRMMAGLKARGVAANIIIVSDHGMAATSPDRVIQMDQVAPAGSFRMIDGGAMAGIAAMPGQEAVLAAALLRPHDYMQCWRKGDIPKALAYGRNPRVPAFICLAAVGWSIPTPAWKQPIKRGGSHGYDNRAPEMAALFVATGPNFRPGVALPAFDNVDVHPLMMRLLGLKPRPSDGSDAPLRPALR